MDGKQFWDNVEKRRGFMRDSDLARVAGVPKPTVSSWKRSGVIPRGDKAVAIARAMGVTLEELIPEEATV